MGRTNEIAFEYAIILLSSPMQCIDAPLRGLCGIKIRSMEPPAMIRGEATMMLGTGASCVLFALWNLSDQTICSWCTQRPISGTAYLWLFDTFGHWGPRAVLLGIGALLILASFTFKSDRRDVEVPAASRLGDVLLWASVILVLCLLTFIAVGPLLKNPRIDAIIDHWRERYFWIVVAIAMSIALLTTFWFDWKRYRETGELSGLFRIAAYSVLAIVGIVLVTLGF